MNLFIYLILDNWIFLTYYGGSVYQHHCNNSERSTKIMISCVPDVLYVSKYLFWNVVFFLFDSKLLLDNYFHEIFF